MAHQSCSVSVAAGRGFWTDAGGRKLARRRIIGAGPMATDTAYTAVSTVSAKTDGAMIHAPISPEGVACAFTTDDATDGVVRDARQRRLGDRKAGISSVDDRFDDCFGGLFAAFAAVGDGSDGVFADASDDSATAVDSIAIEAAADAASIEAEHAAVRRKSSFRPLPPQRPGNRLALYPGEQPYCVGADDWADDESPRLGRAREVTIRVQRMR